MWPAEEQCSLRAGFPAFQPNFSTSAFLLLGFLGLFFCGILLGGVFSCRKWWNLSKRRNISVTLLRSRLQMKRNGTWLITFYIASTVFKDRNLQHHNPFFAGFFPLNFFPLKPAVRLVLLSRARLVTNLLNTGITLQECMKCKGTFICCCKTHPELTIALDCMGTPPECFLWQDGELCRVISLDITLLWWSYFN